MSNLRDQAQPVRESDPAVLIPATEQMLADAAALAENFALFAALLGKNGPPPLWRRDPSFETLVRFILEQQVSLASAQAAFGRLDERLGAVTPERLLRSTDDELKADGFSRQKMGYVRGIAEIMVDCTFDPAELPADPCLARERLLEIRGIGPWTASCFSLFVRGDRDVWPTGDRALYLSIASNLDLGETPDREHGDAIALAWSPWRSTAAKMLWYDYLGGRSHVAAPGAGFIEGTGKVRP